MASEALNPFDHPQDWDSIRIGNVASPGVCTIDGFDREYGWDVKKGKGTAGATLTQTTTPPAEGTVTFELWDDGHFREWAEFRPLLKYDPAKKRNQQAISIYHPSLADLDIASVVTKKISPIKHLGGGRYQVKVEFIEFFPVPKVAAVSTPTSSKTTAGANKVGASDDPVADEQQRQIAALLKQAGSA
jgi:hypothetical protein